MTGEEGDLWGRRPSPHISGLHVPSFQSVWDWEAALTSVKQQRNKDV